MRELFHKASEADRVIFISAVNWAEVLYRMERKQGKSGRDIAHKLKQICIRGGTFLQSDSP